MPCGWEGNRRFGVALTMHHRLKWFIHLRLMACTLLWSMTHLSHILLPAQYMHITDLRDNSAILFSLLYFTFYFTLFTF